MLDLAVNNESGITKRGLQLLTRCSGLLRVGNGSCDSSNSYRWPYVHGHWSWLWRGLPHAAVEDLVHRCIQYTEPLPACEWATIATGRTPSRGSGLLAV